MQAEVITQSLEMVIDTVANAMLQKLTSSQPPMTVNNNNMSLSMWKPDNKRSPNGSTVNLPKASVTVKPQNDAKGMKVIN